MMMKTYYMMIIALGSLLFSRCEKIETVNPNFDVTTAKATFRVGEKVTFQLRGNADFLLFYSGEPGNDNDHPAEGRAIPVKSMAENMPEKFAYIYTELGNYQAVFVGKRSDFSGVTEIAKKVEITITEAD